MSRKSSSCEQKRKTRAQVEWKYYIKYRFSFEKLHFWSFSVGRVNIVTSNLSDFPLSLSFFIIFVFPRWYLSLYTVTDLYLPYRNFISRALPLVGAEDKCRKTRPQAVLGRRTSIVLTRSSYHESPKSRKCRIWSTGWSALLRLGYQPLSLSHFKQQFPFFFFSISLTNSTYRWTNTHYHKSPYI